MPDSAIFGRVSYPAMMF